MYDYPRVASDDAMLIAQLRDLKRASSLSLELEAAQYHSPTTVDELAELYLQNPQAQILAGGTDVGLWVTKQLRELPSLIYLGNVSDLRHQG